MTEPTVDSAIYLDTNFFIRAVEGTAEIAEPATKLLHALRRHPRLGVTSEITLAELLAPPKRSDALPLHVKRRVYLDLLVWSGFIRLVPVSRSVLIDPADLRAVSRLVLPDAIHLVSAIQHHCRFFVSADKDFDQMPAGMQRIDPSENGLASLIRDLA